MNIYKILSSKERQKILEDVLYKERAFRVSEVASRLNLSKGLVSGFFNLLTNEGILRKDGTDFTVRDNFCVSALKILLNFNSVKANIFQKYKLVIGAGFFGSFVKGDNTEESDIDLYILVEDSTENNLAKITKELKKENSKISPLYLTGEKINELKDNDPVFYHSLVFGSIRIYGKGIDEF
jgi:predicted nucleotidyltransferase